MLKFISKFVLTIFPSVAASVIGAYIAHNYINAKPADQTSAVATSVLTPGADSAAGNAVLPVTPIPVNARVADAAVSAASRSRVTSDDVASTGESAAPGRDRHAAHPRHVNAAARAAGERLGIAHRSRAVEVSGSPRERVHTGNVETSAAPAHPVLMPAVDLVPDDQSAPSPAQGEIGVTSDATRAGPDRTFQAADIPLMKRLAGLSSDMETKLVSQTLSTADDIVTAAKSAIQAVMTR
jgi:hypothetical protein